MRRFVITLSPAFPALLHGVNDLCAGYLLARYSADLPEAITGFLVYGLLAFGGQLPVGMWLDQQPHLVKRTLVVAGGLLALTALLAGMGWLMAAIVVAGFASAAVHVAGGTMAMEGDDGTRTGMFAAPGVLGLATGGWMGAQFPELQLFVLIGIALLGPALAILAVRTHSHTSAPAPAPAWEAHDGWMLLLLGAIAFRSLAWNVVDALAGGNHQILLGLALAAFVGKLAGGWLGTRIGLRQTTWALLGGALTCFAVARRLPEALYAGVSLLQAATPTMLIALRNLMPRRPSAAAGLAFGTAILVGGLPMLSAAFQPWMTVTVAGGAVLMALLAWGLVKES